MTRRRRVRAAVAIVIALWAAGSCSTSASGPRMKVCGVWIGAADDGGLGGGPYWVDLTASDPPRNVQPYGDPATPAGTHLRVSRDCAHGAVVQARPADAAAVSVEAAASDGRAAEVIVQLRAGHDAVTVDAREPGGRMVAVTLAKR